MAEVALVTVSRQLGHAWGVWCCNMCMTVLPHCCHTSPSYKCSEKEGWLAMRYEASSATYQSTCSNPYYHNQISQSPAQGSTSLCTHNLCPPRSQAWATAPQHPLLLLLLLPSFVVKEEEAHHKKARHNAEGAGVVRVGLHGDTSRTAKSVTWLRMKHSL